MSRSFVIIGLTVALSAAADTTSGAQVATHAETMAEVSRLRDAREFTAAIALLRRHLVEHPSDTGAARLLAETLYWTGDVDGARRAYEEAHRRHPGDAATRLQHARMLVQLNEQTGARELLHQLRDVDETAAEAETLLGTLALGRGDLATARTHFRTALRLRPEQADAERGLAQIQEATAPWVQTGIRSYEDDQPLSQLTVVGAAGVYLSPLHSLLGQAEAERFTAEDARAGTAATVVLRSYWPRLRLQSELAGGLRWGPPMDRPEWTGRIVLGLRFPRHLVASIAAEREPYLRTFASLWEPVMIESSRGRLDWETPSGWLGQASYTRVWYPDANVGESAYGWILAPLVRGARGQIRGGYAYAWEDTRLSRFTHAFGSAPSIPIPGRSVGRVPPGKRPPNPTSARDHIQGYYAPYYTPIGVRAHSVAAAVAVQPAAGIAVRFNGSYGVHARENAPFFYYSPGAGTNLPSVQSGFYIRRYKPLNARAGMDAVLARGLDLQLELEHTRTAFWRGTQVRVGLLYRFLPGRLQRAD